MGVPAFFRWLSRKYPSIVVHCTEEKSRIIDGVKVPVNTSLPNPNKIEFDNLYLDMNGIIHPCCHPEDKPAPKNEDEMMVLIFEYIDRLFSIVRPRRLLYMAIDGVAPRAKMNQQRSRRFRASKETKEMREEMQKVKDALREKGMEVPPDKPASEHFDSNCITPGTEFMFRLADCLRYYIHHRLNTDPGWANIVVILSDANVPGEGEHKVMDYIRHQRAQPNHDPNTHHCLCGADADLIMLGLATHEVNFTIIREEFKPNKAPTCNICGQIGHNMKECAGVPKEKQGEFDEKTKPFQAEQEFIFLRLSVLREYLYHDLNMTNLPFKQDLERAIDDWVLMCFFVGNDFLPHLPSLEIREGAIDKLITLYKKAVYKTGGYLTDSGTVNLARVQLILTDLGEMEDQIFKNRRQTEVQFKQRDDERRKRQKRMTDSNAPRFIPGGQYTPVTPGGQVTPIVNPRQTVLEMRQQAMHFSTSGAAAAGGRNDQNQDAAASLKSMLSNKRKSVEMEQEEEDAEPEDNVKLWEDGWKDRYYENKFGISSDDIEFRHKVANEYVLGICWVLKYYYQGCASWDWYFPYHYAPFASDFVNIGDQNTDFVKGTKPFQPLEQLMSVFPAASKNFLPPSWQDLMANPESPIIDFYPIDFRVDLNGKKFAWQGVALLPFVDEVRLLETLKSVYPDLTEYEQKRNIRGKDRLFVGGKYLAHDYLEELYKHPQSSELVELNPDLTLGIRGQVWCDSAVVGIGDVVKSLIPQLEDCPNNRATCVLYQDPQYPDDFVFPARILPGAVIPSPSLKPQDFDRRNQGQSYQPQTGFTRDNSYRNNMNSSSAIRHVRGALGSGPYSQAPPPSLMGGSYRGGSGGRGGYGNQGNSYSNQGNSYGNHSTSYGSQGNGRSSDYGNYSNNNSNYSHYSGSRGGGIGGAPPVSWQRNISGQGSAYQQNQQRGYQQNYPSQAASRDYRNGSAGYGQSGNYGARNPYSAREIESYSTGRGGTGLPRGGSSGPSGYRQSYPYPPQRHY